MSVMFLYTTCPDEKSVRKIIGHLLRKKLIACANFWPIKSVYWWEGKLERAKETAVVLKTGSKNWKKIETEIKKIHPYQTPCIVKIDVKTNKEYANWICSI